MSFFGGIFPLRWGLFASLVFVAAFILVFRIFFTNIMHTYFPEPFFG